MKLDDLVAGLAIRKHIGQGNPEVLRITYDSRQVREGSLFVAVPGFKSDGSLFVQQAISQGAVAVVGETPLTSTLSVPFLQVENSRRALAELALQLAGHPEQKLRLIAVTGTNGKTTVAGSLAHVLNEVGIACGVIGTLGIQYGSAWEDSPRTTPESSDLAPHLAEMALQGFQSCVMEATSIGIVLERVHALPFEICIFTNLTRDHLDFHGTWDAYREAKLDLFRRMPKSGTALINFDDPAADNFCEQAAGRVLTFGTSPRADFCAQNPSLGRSGLQFEVKHRSGVKQIQSTLIGGFNVSNLCAVYAAAHAMGIDADRIRKAIASIPVVRGRAEVVPSSAPFTIVVDYAHTPDALLKILESLRELKPSRILTVIGAGGDRDRGKRPEMTRAAESLSDLVFLTSDNPRSEDPEAILRDMEAGISDCSHCILDPDRRRSIEAALEQAREHDVVLIAGKGHETYQEIRGVKHPFDDRQVALDWLARAGLSA